MQEYLVKTGSGIVRGHENNGLVEYLGIPFAQPPVGKLRFKRARAVTPWEGVFDADKYGAEAVQFDEGELKGEEDCLTLNIQRPMKGEKLPVFLWIHGGGYNTGSAGVPLYNGASFAREGIVFVSIQYRLNVLGFYDFTTYPGCEDFESNCGVSDQILAIQWVHENIAAFGGDPERVTIAGESAGGASVINMLACPAVKGMFQQAIAQSGLPNCIATHKTARENIDLFLEGMGWTEADLPKLRTIDPYELQKGNTYVAEKHQYKNPGIYLPGPVIDDLLPERPIDAIRNGSAQGVKLIIGTNLNEGTMFVHPEKTGFPNCWEMVGEMFEKNGHEDSLEKFKDYYKSIHPEEMEQMIQFATDYAFQMGALKVAEGQRKYGDVWMYRYEFISKSGEETKTRASHAYELPCVFENRDFGFSRFVFDGESEETVEKIIAAIHTPWVSFTKTGNPDAENWPCYTGYNSKVRIFDRNTETKQLDRTEMMRVWEDIRFYED